MKSFKRKMLYASVTGLCLLFATAAPVMAQDAPPPPYGNRGPGGPRGGDHMADRLAQRLNLSADQTAQVKAIQSDTRAQEMALRKGEMDKIRALLNDDQRAKFDQMQSHMQSHMQQGHGHRSLQNNQGAPPPPPPQ